MWLLVAFIVSFFEAIFAMQCFFCFSDVRTTKDDCILISALSRTINCETTVRECVVYLQRDPASHNLTGEIVRDCMMNSALLVPGEYMTCSGDLCNNFNFPPDRLLCQQCENCDQIQREPQLCRLYFKYHMACITYIMRDNNQIKRGCQADHNDNTCDEGKEKCVYCTQDDCNRDPRTRKLNLGCYFCDQTDGDCYYIQEHTAMEVIAVPVALGTARYCWTLFAGPNNGVVFRYHEFSTDFLGMYRKFCGPKDYWPSPQCRRCFGNFCNKQFEVAHCYECLEGDPNCDSEGEKLTSVYCEHNYLEDYGCYGLETTSGTNDIVRRGCITDLDYLHRKSCEESPNCFFCRGNNCNQRVISCYSCTGTMISGNTTGCYEIDSESDTVLCGSGDSCYLYAWSNDNVFFHIERGCIGENLLVNPWQGLLEGQNFKYCHTDLCNKMRDVLAPHECLNAEGKVLICAKRTNHCFTVHFLDAKGETLIERDCYDPTEKFRGNQTNCDTHIATCNICSGTRCNSNPLTVRMELKCLVCSYHRDCMYYNDQWVALPCSGTRYFYEHETCFYGLDPFSRTVVRGCTLVEFPKSRSPPSHFWYCPSDGCNDPSVNDYQCYQCDSNSPTLVPGYCFIVKGQPNEAMLTPSACAGEPKFRVGDRGCYTYYSPTRILKRGCIRHLTGETIAYCLSNQTHCKLCYEEGCNGFNINSGRSSLQPNWIACLASIFGLIKGNLRHTA